MVFLTLEDFLSKAAQCRKLSREEEIACARQMQTNDASARERLIESYTPMVAGYIDRLSARGYGMGLVVYFMNALERAVDAFDFLQDREHFAHRLGRCLRQAFTEYITRNHDA